MLRKIEAALGWWGRFVAENAIWVILVTLVATAGFATQLKHFKLDTSSEGYYHADDPVRLQYDAFREAFGRDSVILLALRPRGGVFEAAFLEELRTIHQEIEEEVPMLEEVTSLLNVRETFGTEDGLEVGDFLEDWPESEAEIAALKERALANSLYHNYVVSEDGSIAALVIETQAYSVSADIDALAGFDEYAKEGGSGVPITGDEDMQIAEALQSIAARHRSEALEIHLAGAPVFSAVLSRRMGADMALFTGLSVVLVAVFLALLFRRAAAVVLPLVTVGLSVVATLSLMGATRTPMMPPTQIIPSFLLSVGVGGAIHLLAIFYQALRRGDDKASAISYALAHSGLAIVMTSLTTAGGLLSFIPAALRPISHFGAVTPVGVMLSLVYILTLLPALMAVFPMRDVAVRDDETASQRALIAIGGFSTRHPGRVLLVWAVVFALSLGGMVRVTLGHAMLEWMPEEEPMRQATHFLNDNFGGAASFEVLIDSGVENGLHEPEFLKKLDAAQQHAVEFDHDGLRGRKTISIVDVVKETHRALNENQQDFYAIPDSRALVSQELLLFENSGSDDVENLVTPQFEVARMTVRVPFVDGAFYMPYLNKLLPELRTILGPDVNVYATGAGRLLGGTISAALETMVQSYASALVVITLLMIALIGTLRMGLIAMLPNLAPVLFALGLMGWIGVPLDMFTLMIGSIVLGLAVDDTIHFMHNFRREFERSGDVDGAVRETLRGTGEAMLFTSCVLASGFLVYTQAYMVHVFNFGLLTASAIAVAFLADVTLGPALVKLATRLPAVASTAATRRP